LRRSIFALRTEIQVTPPPTDGGARYLTVKGIPQEKYPYPGVLERYLELRDTPLLPFLIGLFSVVGTRKS
jgi:hypothetical protein